MLQTCQDDEIDNKDQQIKLQPWPVFGAVGVSSGLGLFSLVSQAAMLKIVPNVGRRAVHILQVLNLARKLSDRVP